MAMAVARFALLYPESESLLHVQGQGLLSRRVCACVRGVRARARACVLFSHLSFQVYNISKGAYMLWCLYS
jgi:hypothetical protein